MGHLAYWWYFWFFNDRRGGGGLVNGATIPHVVRFLGCSEPIHPNLFDYRYIPGDLRLVLIGRNRGHWDSSNTLAVWTGILRSVRVSTAGTHWVSTYSMDHPAKAGRLVPEELCTDISLRPLSLGVIFFVCFLGDNWSLAKQQRWGVAYLYSPLWIIWVLSR